MGSASVWRNRLKNVPISYRSIRPITVVPRRICSANARAQNRCADASRQDLSGGSVALGRALRGREIRPAKKAFSGLSTSPKLEPRSGGLRSRGRLGAVLGCASHESGAWGSLQKASDLGAVPIHKANDVRLTRGRVGARLVADPAHAQLIVF